MGGALHGSHVHVPAQADHTEGEELMEHRLFEGAVPFVSTAEFHADRERAPHLEQEWHRPRLERAAEFVRRFGQVDPVTVSDLGCGDGGLLQLLDGMLEVRASWGYDFAPANAAGWRQRQVNGELLDVFGKDWDQVLFGQVVVMTEVLEHVADPHRILRLIRESRDPVSLLPVSGLVVSSPWNETPANHSPEHAWAWDREGYAAMIEGAGWAVARHDTVGLFQVVSAV
jgi:trans-aconitate methyltransferase